MNKITEIEMGQLSQMAGTEVKVVGTQTIQIQFVCEEDLIDGFIDLSRNEARELAKVIIEHCDEADQKNAKSS